MKRACRVVRFQIFCFVLFLFAPSAFGQSGPAWTGQVQCQLDIQNADYVHHETQNWMITGPPTQQGAMQLYPATWSTSGQGTMQRMQGTQATTGQWATNVSGMNAPFAIYVRPSDQKLAIAEYHMQVVAPNAVIGTKQFGVTRTNFTFSASEWRFPAIEAGPNDTVVNGSGTVQVAGGSLPQLSPSVTAIANCRWQFNRNGGAMSSASTTTSSSSMGPPVPAVVTPPPSTQLKASNIGTSPPANSSAARPSSSDAQTNNSPNTTSKNDAPQSTTPSTNSSDSQPMAHSHTPVGKISTFVDKDTEDYEKATGFIAQIMFQIDQLMDDQAIQQFTADEWKEIEQQTGGKLIKNEHVFRLPAFPASGYWLSLGQQRYMVSYKGIVNTPTRPTNTKDLALYVQVGDAQPYAVLPSVDFVDSSAKPTPTVFKLLQKLPASMNRSHDHASFDQPLEPNDWLAKLHTLEYNESAHHSCAMNVAQQQFSDSPILHLIPDRCRTRPACPPGSNAEACCLDYDGPYGDGKPIARHEGPDCLAVGARFFEWSTCFIWTVAGACSNEAALPWNNLDAAAPAPDCYSNHKYRNCQNLDPKDFKLNPPSTLIKFGESTDLWLRNNTVGNSTCLDIDSKGPAAKIDLDSLGTLVHDRWCGDYRADHFSDQAQKHYERMKFHFIVPKITTPKPCKATYKVVASSGGKVSNATIVATNPRCGGWSGTITYQRVVEWGLSEDVGGPFESQVHMSEDMDTTLSIRNNTGISESNAKETYTAIAYQGALRGQAHTRIVQSTTNTNASANGGSAVLLEVRLNEKTGDYEVDAGYLPPVGNSHTIATSYDKVLYDGNSPYSGDPLVNSHFTKIAGNTTDPKHIQGSWSEDVKPPPEHKYNGGGKVAVSWNLTFTPGPQ